jgi:hypothetical protein
MSLKCNPFILICSLVLTLASCGKEKSVDTIGVTPGGTNGNGNGNGTGNGGGSGSGNGGGSSNGSEVGTWKFIEMNVKTNSTVEISGMGMSSKTVTLSDYTTENNAGTVKFDGSNMVSTGLEYTVNAMSKTYLYTDGVLDDEIELPFNAAIPPTSSNATYKKIGTDSIYVTGGTFQTPNGGTQQGSSGGYKLSWAGDKMFLSGNYSQSNTQLNQGFTQKTYQSAITVITLQKQ